MKMRGFTLINVVIAIAISAIIGTAITLQIQSDANRELLAQSPVIVQRLHQSVERYYDSHCQSGSVTSPSLTTLVNEGHLDSIDSVIIPLGTISNIIIRKNGSEPSFIYVITYKNNTDAILATSNSENVSISGNRVTWTLTNQTEQNVQKGSYLSIFGQTSC